MRTVGRGSDTRSFYRPRFSSDGMQILTAVHDSGFWRIALIDARSGDLRFLRPVDGANWFDASFADDSTILATTDATGIPTVMLFVKSLRGLSHTKEEDTPVEDLELSVRALDELTRRALEWAA